MEDTQGFFLGGGGPEGRRPGKPRPVWDIILKRVSKK